MEVVKNVAAVLGIILSSASVIALVSKSARTALTKLVRKYGNAEEAETTIGEIKALLERHIADDDKFKSGFQAQSEINLEFTKAQCRNLIKNIFYRYEEVRVLPLYEKKTLIMIEDLYINRLKGNSFAELLLDEMRDWEIDYNNCHPKEK